MGYHSFNHNHAPYKRQPTIFRAARYRSVSASKVSAKRGGIRAQDPLVRDAIVTNFNWGWVGPRVGLGACGKSLNNWDFISRSSSPYQVTILTELSRLFLVM